MIRAFHVENDSIRLEMMLNHFGESVTKKTSNRYSPMGKPQHSMVEKFLASSAILSALLQPRAAGSGSK